MKKKILNFFMFVTTLVLLYIILRKINWNSFLKVFSTIKPLWYLLGLIAVFLGVLLQAYRWSICFSKKSNLRYLYLLIKTIISYFFNQFFLAFMGGDIYRTMSISDKISKKKSIFSLLITRSTNIWGAALFPLPSYLFFKSFFKQNNSFMIIVYFSFFAWVLLFFLICMYVVSKRKISGWFYKYIPEKWHNLGEMLNFKNSILLFGTSILFQFIAIFSHFFYARALGIDLNFVQLSIAIPAILFVTSLPISINGIGVREGGFIVALGFFGIDVESAFALSLLSYLGSIFMGFFGGVLFLIKKVRVF